MFVEMNGLTDVQQSIPQPRHINSWTSQNKLDWLLATMQPCMGSLVPVNVSGSRRDLHWLLIEQWIILKIVVLTFDCCWRSADSSTIPPEKSLSTSVLCSVPRGSVLSHLLFLLCASDIRYISSKHHINSHSFADDTQLYLSGNPKGTQLLRSSIVVCINKITKWCTVELNQNKTKFLWRATARRQNQLDHNPIDLSVGNIRPSKAVRDLGIMID